MLLKKFLNWSLKMLWPMCSYETSMLLLATGIFVRILNGGESVKKQLGCTWIEVNNEVQTFVVDDQGHQMIEICAELKRLSGLMHDAGYAPYTKFVLHDVEEEEKVSHLHHHREKLAVAFRLINTAPGTPLQIIKNLWVCEDCHTLKKFISKAVGRAIMVRETNLFHHF
jgi:hypothetical protein